MQDVTTIAEKIKKILAKADSTTSAEESDAFMQKAHKMMMEHGLSMMDLGTLGEDAVGVDKQAFTAPKAYNWITPLTDAAAKYFGCRVVSFKDTQYTYDVFGRESARVVFALMMPYLKKEVGRLTAIGFTEGHYASRMVGASRIGHALALRLYDLARQQTQQYEGDTANALVPVDVIKAFMDATYPTRVGKARNLKADSFARSAAATVNLHAQVGRGSQKALGR